MMRFFGTLFLLFIFININAELVIKTQKQRDPFVRTSGPILIGENLQDFPIDTLKLVGTMIQNSQKFAVICDAQKHLYTLKLGDLMGLEKAKITYIADGEIGVEWVVQQQVFSDRLVVSG